VSIQKGNLCTLKMLGAEPACHEFAGKKGKNKETLDCASDVICIPPLNLMTSNSTLKHAHFDAAKYD
jgi:hypothetical protein